MDVSTTPIQLSDGSAAIVHVGNSGSPGRRVTLSWAGQTRTLDPGYSTDIKPGGAAVVGSTALGTTTVTVSTTGAGPQPWDGAGAGGGIPDDGSVTTPKLGSDVVATLTAKADLVGGKVPTAQIPALAIGETKPVDSEAEMLALAVQEGDVAIRNDVGETFILYAEPATILANWKQILAVGQVQSVAGKTGVVALVATDIGGGVFDIARLPVGTTGSTVAAGNVAAGKADKTITITAGAGLTGGGDLSAARSLAVAYGSAAGTSAQGNDSRITGSAPDSAVVHNTGAESIDGVKTFTSSPIVPTPTTTGQAATKGYVDSHETPEVTVYASSHGVVGDSNGTSGNGFDNTTALRDAYAEACTLTTTVTGQDWVNVSIVLPAGSIRFTDTIVGTPDAAGANVAPIRGVRWIGQGRRATELFFDKASTATEDPRLNTAFILGNRALGWSWERMSARSLDSDNSFYYGWCRDNDDTVMAFPEYGRGSQSDSLFSMFEWRGAWKRAIGLAGDHQANLNSEMILDRCSLSNDATFSDAYFHIGMPMYGALHMRITGTLTGGTYLFSDGAGSTSSVAYNASGATIATALGALASIGAGNVTATAVSDGFLLRFTGPAESIDTTTITITTSLTGTNPAIVLFRRPIQESQFLNYQANACRFELGGGNVFRVGRGGNINCVGGSYIAVGTSANITFFRLEDEASHAESTCRLWVAGVRFELRAATHQVINSKWNKGSITFDSCMDSAQSFQGFAATLPAHSYDFTTQGLSRGPMVVYRSCELMGYHEFITHPSVAVTGGGASYEDSRFMNNSTATGPTTGMIRYSGVPLPYEVRRCHGSSYTRIPNSMAIWTAP